ncbi:hypothetical protein BESB_004760 [Besnoitia besnoiti]|uniref:Transmembrane protein n=1 Tax=Besnoitia besnoiti TaxID=94643 RepID=A0A2A9MJI7_BESBE|nr:hypothetical protein BESB_004760 [Besnoitia besnoiti]PFH38135.1 hypothetical protein BESB_004760 [Besnoitia besnoiti]
MEISVSDRRPTLCRHGTEARPVPAERLFFSTSKSKLQASRVLPSAASPRRARRAPSLSLLLIPCGLFLCLASAGANDVLGQRMSSEIEIPPASELCALKGIDLSTGVLTSFSQDTLEYEVEFETQQAELIVVPRFECSEGIATHLFPAVSVNSHAADPRGALGVTLPVPAARRFDVRVQIRNPSFSPTLVEYVIHVDQASAVKEPTLRSFAARDSQGNLLPVTPLFSDSNEAFVLAARADDAYVRLEATCDPDSALYVNGQRVVLSSAVTISRDEQQPSSLTTVQCRHASVHEAAAQQRSFFFETLWTRTNLVPPSKLIVHSNGKACQVILEEDSRILCENSSGLTSLFAIFPPSMYYKVTSAADQAFVVPLVNGGWTPRFPLRIDLQIVARAGAQEKTWKLDFANVFVPSHGPSLMSGVREFSAVCLLLSLLFIAGLLFLALLTGQGGAAKFSEVPLTALTFFQASFFLHLLQEGPQSLQSSATLLRWTALFLPLPYTAETNVELAAGCLIASAALLVLASLLRAFFAAAVLQREAEALPHSLKFGNAESRLLHAVACPVAAAAAMLVAEPDSPMLLRFMGVLALAFLTTYWLAVFTFVRGLVASGRVTWVWSYPFLDGSDDSAGAWCDTRSDQILTEPVNWTVWVQAPTGTWAAPAAQIEPVTVCSGAKSLHAGLQKHMGGVWYLRSDGPTGTAAVDVQVLQPKAGPALLPCMHELPVGIARSEWLDCLFTVENLTRFIRHLRRCEREEAAECATGKSHFPSSHAVLPLTVKQCQLTGPITGGRFALFFELRTPCARIGDGVVRSLCGALLGFAVSRNSVFASLASATATSLTLVALVAFVWTLYIYFDRPFHRLEENACFPVLFAILGLTAAMTASPLWLRASFLPCLLEYISAAALLGLALFTAFLAVCLLLGIFWPAMQDIRFLPRLCNSSLLLTDRARHFLVSAPAYNRFGARNVVLECVAGAGRGASGLVRHVPPAPDGYAQMELSVDEFGAVCSTGEWTRPRACICLDSSGAVLGFRSLTLYERDDAREVVGRFINDEPGLAEAYPELFPILVEEIESEKNGGEVVTILVRRPGCGGSGKSRRSGSATDNANWIDREAWDSAWVSTPPQIQLPGAQPLLRKRETELVPRNTQQLCPNPLSNRVRRAMC